MAVDPEVQELLDKVHEVDVSLASLSVADARSFMEMVASTFGGSGNPSVRTTDQRIPGPAGDIPIRTYRPSETTERLPVIVYFHGGGWVVGSLATHDGTCRDLSVAAHAVVVSVDYRLAPEHRFPAAVEDADAAMQWVATNAEQLGGDADRLAVAGDSAGGNLAAVVARRCRDRGSPRLSSQVLVYPVTDHCFTTQSYVDKASGYLLTRDDMEWFWAHYVPDLGQRSDPDASPLRAEDLAGLPAAFVLTAEHDPLRDEGEAYARLLQEAGVPVVVKRYPGMVHGFFSMGPVVAGGRQALADAAAALRQWWAQSSADQPLPS